jgi:AraC family transcriptional regulator of adaptative response / DNA-3-methyladenine glycosylase II
MDRRPLAKAEMLQRFLAADAAYDGRFVTAVTTTGIFCLPSCSAKKPKPENVQFFRDRDGAVKAGFRACRRCRPDDFYARRDPELEQLDEMVAAARSKPDEYRDVDALVSAAPFSATKLNTLLREHYHSTPALLLRRWRVEHAARKLLHESTSISEIAFASGFESLSTFNENFRRVMAIAPGDYRRLVSSPQSFKLSLPEQYRSEDVVRYAARLGEGGGKVIRRSFMVDAGPVTLTLRFHGDAVRAAVESGPLDANSGAQLHRAALRILGLSSDPEPFEGWINSKPALRPLIAGRSGVRNPSTPTPFEALAWSIIGQQVNVSFATALQNDLVALCDLRTPAGELAYPTAKAVAQLDYADLTSRRFSRSKAAYLIDSARLVVNEELPLESLSAGSATAARKALMAVRGIGPWSANYVMMRGFGFDDCAPIGDTGLSSGLQIFFRLKKRPDAATTEKLMRRFAPYRTYATLHLWMTKWAETEE